MNVKAIYHLISDVAVLTFSQGHQRSLLQSFTTAWVGVHLKLGMWMSPIMEQTFADFYRTNFKRVAEAANRKLALTRKQYWHVVAILRGAAANSDISGDLGG